MHHWQPHHALFELHAGMVPCNIRAGLSEAWSLTAINNNMYHHTSGCSRTARCMHSFPTPGPLWLCIIGLLPECCCCRTWQCRKAEATPHYLLTFAEHLWTYHSLAAAKRSWWCWSSTARPRNPLVHMMLLYGLLLLLFLQLQIHWWRVSQPARHIWKKSQAAQVVFCSSNNAASFILF